MTEAWRSAFALLLPQLSKLPNTVLLSLRVKFRAPDSISRVDEFFDWAVNHGIFTDGSPQERILSLVDILNATCPLRQEVVNLNRMFIEHFPVSAQNINLNAISEDVKLRIEEQLKRCTPAPTSGAPASAAVGDPTRPISARLTVLLLHVGSLVASAIHRVPLLVGLTLEIERTRCQGYTLSVLDCVAGIVLLFVLLLSGPARPSKALRWPKNIVLCFFLSFLLIARSQETPNNTSAVPPKHSSAAPSVPKSSGVQLPSPPPPSSPPDVLFGRQNLIEKAKRLLAQRRANGRPAMLLLQPGKIVGGTGKTAFAISLAYALNVTPVAIVRVNAGKGFSSLTAEQAMEAALAKFKDQGVYSLSRGVVVFDDIGNEETFLDTCQPPPSSSLIVIFTSRFVFPAARRKAGHLTVGPIEIRFAIEWLTESRRCAKGNCEEARLAAEEERDIHALAEKAGGICRSLDLLARRLEEHPTESPGMLLAAHANITQPDLAQSIAVSLNLLTEEEKGCLVRCMIMLAGSYTRTFSPLSFESHYGKASADIMEKLISLGLLDMYEETVDCVWIGISDEIWQMLLPIVESHPNYTYARLSARSMARLEANIPALRVLAQLEFNKISATNISVSYASWNCSAIAEIDGDTAVLRFSNRRQA